MKYRARKFNSSLMRNLAKHKLLFSIASYESGNAHRTNLFLRRQVLEKSMHLFTKPVTPNLRTIFGLL